MEIVDLPLAGLKLVKPRVFADPRGFFVETWRRDVFAQAGIAIDFVQDNHSRSAKDTVRGLHFQRPGAQGRGQSKLVRASRGRVFDVAVDVRPESPTYLKWHGEVLDDTSHHALFVPVGFAHGFCVLSESADVCYRVDAYYDPSAEIGFAFDDPLVGVAWPVSRSEAILSRRDQEARPYREVATEKP
ncbi:MAG: dTDP-4-dehydrorhamnose 3,5-epimerase [Deltaproteobacteria bacterium]|nr:dTDP-4-dehydrorhamnose 3,5-epimerase [Deltaproteobacteria bacterium]